VEKNVRECYVKNVDRDRDENAENKGETGEGFVKGDRVLVKYLRGRAGFAYYYAIIKKAREKDRMYDITYSDGEKGTVPFDRVRRTSPNDSTNPTLNLSKFRVRQRVLARYKGWSKFYSGLIVKENKKAGTFSIDYDDGSKERNVKPRYIKKEESDGESDYVAENDEQDEAGSSDEGSDEESSGEQEPTYCGKCGQETRDEEADQVIICDGCEREFHFGCVGIVVLPKEEEDFFCESCAKPKKTKRKRNSSNAAQQPEDVIVEEVAEVVVETFEEGFEEEETVEYLGWF